MKESNKGLMIIFFIFLVVNALDLITAQFIKGGEANPLYLLTRSMWPLVIGKILITLAIYWVVKKNIYPSHFQYFMFVLIMLYGTLALGMGVYNNSQGIMKPEIVEQAKQIPDNIKIQLYTQFTVIAYFLPMTMSLLAFKVYEWTVKQVTFKKM